MGFFRKFLSFHQELDLLRTVLAKLPVDVMGVLLLQLESGLIKSTIKNASDLPGYCAFTFNGSVAKKFEDDEISDYRITGILVRSLKKDKFFTYTVFVSSGLLSGYSIQPLGHTSIIDTSWADTSGYFLNREVTNEGWEKVQALLGSESAKAFNPSAVYSIHINGVEYFHLKDLEDGNFLGLGSDGTLYYVSHDGSIIPVQERDT